MKFTARPTAKWTARQSVGEMEVVGVGEVDGETDGEIDGGVVGTKTA